MRSILDAPWRREVLKVIQEHPEGVTGSQIREHIDIDPNELRRCTYVLRINGFIRRKTSGKRYEPVWVIA